MDKLPMCRVCLAENVRMYVVVNKNLRELYEKLTAHPFVTEDSRPMLTCFFCCTKLKQCYQFQQKCLEAETLFAQMMNENYEPNSLLNQEYREFCNGFIQSPMVHVSIVHECQTENIVIKEELPSSCERLDDIIVPKEEHQSDELELENMENSFSAVEDVPTQSDSEEPLVQEHEVSTNNRTASDTQRVSAAKKPKLHPRRTKLEQKEYEQSDTTVIQNPQNCTFTTVTKFKEPSPCTTPRVTNSSLDINFRNDSNNEDSIKCKMSSKCINSDDINRHQVEPFKCDNNICQRSFNVKGDLTGHIRLHDGEKPYKCEVCQRCFSRKSSLTNHIRTHAGKKSYKCYICQSRFTQKSYLRKHIRKHTGEKPHKCDVCHRSFNEKCILTNHIRTHTGEKPYKCDICQCNFSQMSNLTHHIRTHTGEKPYKCDICHRSFNLKRNLTGHFRTHTGEKPYQCDVCQRSFTNKSGLTQHIRVHTGEKPYQCDVCQRSFSEKRILANHIRTHTGEKPYKCDICHRSFNQKSILTNHIRTHTGEKPYKCDICQRFFSQRSSLKSHPCARGRKSSNQGPKSAITIVSQ